MATLQSTLTWAFDTTEYPFKSHFFTLHDGQQMHYVDEGDSNAEVLLFVHGTQASSFLYRKFIRHFGQNYRCIAIDHIGYGLSDKPEAYAYTPQQHAQNLMVLVDSLKLDSFHLFVHDFGGPIGLAMAMQRAQRVKSIAIFNTWLWSLEAEPEAKQIARFLKSGLGKWLYTRTNFSPSYLVKKSFYQKEAYTKAVKQGFNVPFQKKSDRFGLFGMAQSLLGSSAWYDSLWMKADVLKDIPKLVLWGTKDPFLKPAMLEKWSSRFPNAHIERLESGHFVQEEKTDESIQLWLKWRKSLS